jgi:hypothetical protein
VSPRVPEDREHLPLLQAPERLPDVVEELRDLRLAPLDERDERPRLVAQPLLLLRDEAGRALRERHG